METKIFATVIKALYQSPLMCYTESNLILPAGKGEVSPMNDRQLLCFLTLSRTLNFTAAARELYCTQPALSYQIRSLERSWIWPCLSAAPPAWR